MNLSDQMDQLATSLKMSRTESGSSRMSGSRTNEGLKGSDVGTRSQDPDGNHPIAATYCQESRRRSFFDHTNRSRRPGLHRRNAAPSVPRISVTDVVETIADLVDGVDVGDKGRKHPFRLTPVGVTLSSTPHMTLPAVPAVPEFPTLLNPSVPTVPTYPFNTPASQSILSSPPPSPAPSDTSFTPTASPAANPSPQPILSSPPPSPAPSDTSLTHTASPTTDPISFSTPVEFTFSSHEKSLDPSDTTTPKIVTSTIDVPYSNTTLATSTQPVVPISTGLVSSADRTTFVTRTSDSFLQSSSRSTASGAAGVAGTAGAAATLSATGTAPVSVGTSGSSPGDPSTEFSSPVGPSTPQVVGGVVGGVAGFAVVLLIVLYFLRRYRQKLQDRGNLVEPDGSGEDAANTMSMRSSHTPLVAAVAASFKKMRPGSSQTTATDEIGASNRGFQRLAGRKIEPVLVSGGDEYGGNYGAFEKETGTAKETGAPSSSHPEAQPLAGTSFYRDNAGFDSRHGSGTSTPVCGQARFAADTWDVADGYDEDHNRGPSPGAIAVMRPSPARSPVTTSAGTSSLVPHTTGPATMARNTPPTPTLPSRSIPDGLGRSLVSQDGSRGSRFTESV